MPGKKVTLSEEQEREGESEECEEIMDDADMCLACGEFGRDRRIMVQMYKMCVMDSLRTY